AAGRSGPSFPARRKVRIATWMAVGGALFGALALYLALVLGYGSTHGPGGGREVDLDWPAGLTPTEAAARLEAAGLVSSPRLFALYLRAIGATADLRPGHHPLSDDMSP